MWPQHRRDFFVSVHPLARRNSFSRSAKSSKGARALLLILAGRTKIFHRRGKISRAQVSNGVTKSLVGPQVLSQGFLVLGATVRVAQHRTIRLCIIRSPYPCGTSTTSV